MNRLPCLFALLALVVTGCGPSLHVPGGFARVDGRHDLRIASPEGVVVAVNVHRNRSPRGDLQFWAGALESRVHRLYGQVDRSPITTDEGMEGVQLRATTVRQGRPHHYWTAVFVTRRKVVVVEAGGDDAYFVPQRDHVEAAMRSVEI